MFVPLCYPTNYHWMCAIMRRASVGNSGVHIKVCSSIQTTEPYHEYIAKALCCVSQYMNPKLSFARYLMVPVQDKVEQRVDNYRCGMHVIARAWQAAQQAPCVLNLKVVDAVAMHVQCALLQGVEKLCGGDMDSPFRVL